MKRILKHIDRVKEQPHHIRRRVSFGVAAGITGLVAVVWLAGNLSNNSFAIAGSSFAESTGQTAVKVVKTGAASETQGLAGAAAALEDAKSAPAHIEIVDTTPVKKPVVEATILPF